jgi:hypothetical protein
VPLPEDYYSPFIKGGTILFRPTPGNRGAEQFTFARMICPDWTPNVALAFAFHNEHPNLLNSSTQTASVVELVELASHETPLLAAVALRNLLSLGLAQPSYVQTQLVRVSGLLCSVLSYLTIVVAGPNVSRPFSQETLQVIDTASDSTLRAIAVGGFAAALFLSRDAAVLARSKAVLSKARARLTAIGGSTEQDSQLSFIFGRLGTY